MGAPDLQSATQRVRKCVFCERVPKWEITAGCECWQGDVGRWRVCESDYRRLSGWELLCTLCGGKHPITILPEPAPIQPTWREDLHDSEEPRFCLGIPGGDGTKCHAYYHDNDETCGEHATIRLEVSCRVCGKADRGLCDSCFGTFIVELGKITILCGQEDLRHEVVALVAAVGA